MLSLGIGALPTGDSYVLLVIADGAADNRAVGIASSVCEVVDDAGRSAGLGGDVTRDALILAVPLGLGVFATGASAPAKLRPRRSPPAAPQSCDQVGMVSHYFSPASASSTLAFGHRLH